MTITDPAHVAAAKLLREQYQRQRPTIDPHEGLTPDLVDYDRAFGLTDTDQTEPAHGPVNGEKVP